LNLETRQEGGTVKKIAIAAALLASAAGATPATSAAPTLGPHTWVTKISGSPIPLLNATWRLGFRSPTYGVTRNGGVVVAGTFKVVGNRVTFHDLAGTLACRGAQVNGRYTWRIQGAKLTLTRVSDACPGRRGVLAHIFTRVA
jgi:hypothetical protein